MSNWSHDFVSPVARVERTYIWIRFPDLNLVFYDESFLLEMAYDIGTLTKVDSNTSKAERGRFARVCVKINLDQSVVGNVWLKAHWYKVEYEGFDMICSECG